MGVWLKLQSVKSFRSFKYNMKSITLASIVFTLSFFLNLVAGKNLPLEDTEDNNEKIGAVREKIGAVGEKIGALGEKIGAVFEKIGEDYRISPISTGVDYGDYPYTQKHYNEDKKRRMKKMKMWRKNKKNIKSF